MANRYWVGGTATWDATAGSKWALTSGGAGGQAIPTTADTVFFDAASGANTVTIGAGVATCSTLTMTGFTGTLAFGSNSITCAGAGTTYTGATTFSVTGTPVINCTTSSLSAITIAATAVTEANSISFNTTVSSANATVSGNIKNLNFTGFSGALANSSRTIYGNLTLSTGMSLNAGTSVTTFGATSGTQTITSNAKTMDFPVTIASTGATVRLIDALTLGATRALGLASGTLDLNDKTATAGTFSSTNSATRAILFGTTGNLTITSNSGTIFNMTTATGFTYTGTPTVNLTYSGSVGTRTISCGNTAGGSEATALDFNVSAGSDIVAIFIYIRNLNFTGFTGTCPNNTRTLYGSLTFSSGMTVGGGTGVLTFASTLIQQNITSATKIIDNVITLSGTQTYQLQDALTMGSTRTLTFTSGALDLNNKTLTTNAFSSSNTNVRSIAFGTLGEINLVGTSATLWTTSANANFSVTGTPTVNATDTSVGNTRTFNQGTGLSNQAVSFYVKAGSGTVNFTTTGGVFQTIDLTGFSGTVAHSSIFCLGDYVIPAGVTVTPTANAIQFVGTAATQKITTSSNVLDFPIVIGRALTTTAATGNGTTATLTFASTGYYPIVGQVITVSGVTPSGYNGTYTVTASSATSVSYLNATTAAQTTAGTVNLATTVQLQDALTMGATRQLSYNSGTIDLNNKTLTTQNVNGTTNAPHTILFGTGEITVTGSNSTVWSNNSATGYPFIATGSKVVNCTYSGSVGSRQITSQVSTPDLYSLNFNITAGSDIFSIQGNRFYNNIDFTGFSGTCVVSSGSTANIVMYGSWTCPAGGAGAIFLSSTTPYGLLFQGTAGNTQTLTSNGYIFDGPIFKTGSPTGTLLLADDLVVTDATSSGLITLSFGIFNSNGKNVTCASFDAENSNTKTFTITNSTFTVTSGTSTEGFIFQSSGTTWNVTGSNIVFTTSGSAVYYGGQSSSVTFPQVTMGGTGQLILGYVNSTTSITTLTNTVQPCTVSVSTTSQLTVTNFNLNGTAGNLVTFNSSVAGTARTISKTSGTVNAQYLSIQDSTATGGAKWYANSSNDLGNNTGWNIFNNSFLQMF